MSSHTQAMALPSFQAILALGAEAIPLILGELTLEPSWLLLALYQLTGETPAIDADDRGRVGRLTEAWLRWGRENDYCV